MIGKVAAVVVVALIWGDDLMGALSAYDVPWVPFVCAEDGGVIQEASYVDQVAHHGAARITQTAGQTMRRLGESPPTAAQVAEAVSSGMREVGEELSKASVTFKAGWEGAPSPLPPTPGKPPKVGPGTMQAGYDPVSGCQPSRAGQDAGSAPLSVPGIPPEALTAYQAAAGLCPGLDWAFLAGIAEVESAHGRNNGPSSAGAVGPFQFMPGTWDEVSARYDVDGNGDGVEDVMAVADAARGAAFFVCDAPGELTGAAGREAALRRYNPGSAEYPALVLGKVGFYSTFTAPADARGAVPAGPWGGYKNGQIPASALRAPVTAKGHLLHPEAAASFDQMSTAFQQQFGAPIMVTDSYRTLASQRDLQSRKPHLAAVAGTSNHGWGLAVDLEGGIQDFGTPQHEWMKVHGPRFGWFHPAWAQKGGSKPEPWHWEYTRSRKSEI